MMKGGPCVVSLNMGPFGRHLHRLGNEFQLGEHKVVGIFHPAMPTADRLQGGINTPSSV
jgi:hypothetical protein